MEGDRLPIDLEGGFDFGDAAREGLVDFLALGF
jgi:hypothetical protein